MPKLKPGPLIYYIRIAVIEKVIRNIWGLFSAVIFVQRLLSIRVKMR